MSESKKNNLTLKIFAVIIAIVLWIYVMGELNPRVTKEFSGVNVNLMNAEEVQKAGLMVMEPKDVNISVKVEGRNNDVLNMSKDSIKAHVDLRGLREGLNKVNVYIEDVEKLEIVDYYPKEVLFKCDKIVSEEIPIDLKIIGKAEPMTTLGNKVLKPSTTFIKGPKSWVDKVDRVVATVDITGQRSRISHNSPIIALDKDGNEVEEITKEPSIVEVSIPVLQTKNVNIEVQTTGETQEGYRITNIEAYPQTVMIKGSEDVIQKIESVNTLPIDLRNTTKGIREETELILPEGVELVNSVNPIANISVEEVVNTVLDYTFDDITIFNLSPELEIDEDSPSDKITIEISGVKSDIQNISQEDIDLHIDLKELEMGKYEVNLDASTTRNIEIVSINPNSIKINLKKRNNED